MMLMMQKFVVVPIPCLSDNYAWLVSNSETQTCLVIDPGESGPVEVYVKQHNLVLDTILLTHHHHDHIGGVAALRTLFGCKVIGAEVDKDRLPTLDECVKDGDMLTPIGFGLRVIATPGHTLGHVSYYAPSGWLFCGDTLFSLGCGRCFECEPEVLWHSLQKLLALPGTTQVCCGHEYTLSNARFALHLEPDNAGLHARVEEVQRKGCSLPALLESEKALNPFLRLADLTFLRSVGLSEKSPALAFADLRRQKDKFYNE